MPCTSVLLSVSLNLFERADTVHKWYRLISIHWLVWISCSLHAMFWVFSPLLMYFEISVLVYRPVYFPCVHEHTFDSLCKLLGLQASNLDAVSSLSSSDLFFFLCWVSQIKCCSCLKNTEHNCVTYHLKLCVASIWMILCLEACLKCWGGCFMSSCVYLLPLCSAFILCILFTDFFLLQAVSVYFAPWHGTWNKMFLSLLSNRLFISTGDKLSPGCRQVSIFQTYDPLWASFEVVIMTFLPKDLWKNKTPCDPQFS